MAVKLLGPDLLSSPLDRGGFRICRCARQGASTDRWDSPFIAPAVGNNHGRRSLMVVWQSWLAGNDEGSRFGESSMVGAGLGEGKMVLEMKEG
ncbi:hypothetical protein V6N13_061107 [Hibiscus sabdariffa]